MNKRIIKKDIDHIVKEALQNFKLHYRQIKGKAGWHQYLGAEKIGTVATAQVLLAFKYFREDFNDKLKIIDSLLKSQIKSADNAKDGGWEYVTNFPGIASLEATCWALMALHEEYGDDPRVLSGLNWLQQNAIKGEADEGWGIVPGDISRVYATCLALKTLKMYGKVNTEAYERGLNWLIKAQNMDHGWGSTAGSPSSMVYTSRVIITLAANGHDIAALRSGVQWLRLRTQNLQLTKANIEQEYKEDIAFGARGLKFHHMPLQLVLTALILSGHTKSITVFDGINDLVTNNNHYYWWHPLFKDSKRKPLWAIFDTLVVCKALQENTYNWASIIMVQYQGKHLVLKEASKPFSWKRFKENFIYGKWGKIFIVICICMIISRAIDTFPKLGTATYSSLIIIPLLIELLGYYLTEIKKSRRRLDV
jgi:hypothetical protein